MQLPRRHIVWFAAAILLPCLALTLLTLRLLDQERQLAARRVHEAAERRIEDARRELLAVLEPYRLGQTPASELAFQGVIRAGKAVLSWEDRRSAHVAASEVVRLERAVQGRIAPEFQRIARHTPEVADELAVPLALYAIPHLPSGNARVATLRPLGNEMLRDPHRFSPVALHLLQSLAAENGLEAVVAAAKSACENAEAGERFQAAYAQTGGAAAGKWLAWGKPLFLVGFAPTARPGELAFRAVPASKTASPVPVSLDRGTPLGDPFGSLRAELPPAATAPEGLGRPLLLAMLGLTVVLALLGGLLLWRDVRREMALAGLRTQFIAAVSHELRTPLTAVRMFIESLKMNPDLDRNTRAEYLDTMLRETERLSRLVNNVLEFSRIERDRKTYVLRPVALAELVASVVASFGPLLEQAGYTLETEIGANVPEVRADPDALEQALLNLLSNAMKFSGPSRQIQLKLLVHADRAEIRVRDFGIGIAPAHQRRIFESFYRAPSKENRSIQGAGLGLTLVRHVMQGHGGEVLVDSAPGQGSTFRLVLPFA